MFIRPKHSLIETSRVIVIIYLQWHSLTDLTHKISLGRFYHELMSKPLFLDRNLHVSTSSQRRLPFRTPFWLFPPEVPLLLLGWSCFFQRNTFTLVQFLTPPHSPPPSPIGFQPSFLTQLHPWAQDRSQASCPCVSFSLPALLAHPLPACLPSQSSFCCWHKISEAV